MMVGLTDGKLMWVIKYECECIKNMEWVKSYKNYKKFTYLAVPEYVRLNWQNNETNDLLCTNRKIMITITILIGGISMHCSINM